MSSDRLSSRLANPIVLVGPCASRRGPLARRRRLELGARDHPVDEPDALGVGRASRSSPKNISSFALLQADEPGQQVGAAAVGDQARGGRTPG